VVWRLLRGGPIQDASNPDDLRPIIMAVTRWRSASLCAYARKRAACISFGFPSVILESRSTSLTRNWRSGSKCAQRYHDGEDGLGASAWNTRNRRKADFNED
jgi:hypothetical protein